MNLIGYSFVSSVKIQSVRQSSEGKANKHFDGQLRGRCKSKSKHQKPPGQQPSADVGKPQTVFCLGASDAQKEPFAKGEKQNRIDPDDRKAVGGQGDSPVWVVLKLFLLSVEEGCMKLSWRFIRRSLRLGQR
jgi:hypothetical protein